MKNFIICLSKIQASLDTATKLKNQLVEFGEEVELFEGSAVSFGANKETYAIRSADQFESEMELLQEETEEFLKSIPRRQRLELRQLMARHISLASIEPETLENKKHPLNSDSKPDEAGLKLENLEFI
jgi:hypothetical protein